MTLKVSISNVELSLVLFLHDMLFFSIECRKMSCHLCLIGFNIKILLDLPEIYNEIKFKVKLKFNSTKVLYKDGRDIRSSSDE